MCACSRCAHAANNRTTPAPSVPRVYIYSPATYVGTSRHTVRYAVAERDTAAAAQIESAVGVVRYCVRTRVWAESMGLKRRAQQAF